ncbi:MAG: hypothetical protein GF309_09965 [Candidatus Lokiarchaeota archaeon]|nr:hypothetical protein [Candidatus Lokiarchaeota archaeon]
MELENASVLMETEVGQESEELVIDRDSSSSNWFLEVSLDEAAVGYYLRFRRINTDVILSLILDIVIKKEVLKNSPFFSIILALCGGGVLAFCSYNSWKIESSIRKRVRKGDELF